MTWGYLQLKSARITIKLINIKKGDWSVMGFRTRRLPVYKRLLSVRKSAMVLGVMVATVLAIGVVTARRSPPPADDRQT